MSDRLSRGEEALRRWLLPVSAFVVAFAVTAGTSGGVPGRVVASGSAAEADPATRMPPATALRGVEPLPDLRRQHRRPRMRAAAVRVADPPATASSRRPPRRLPRPPRRRRPYPRRLTHRRRPYPRRLTHRRWPHPRPRRRPRRAPHRRSPFPRRSRRRRPSTPRGASTHPDERRQPPATRRALSRGLRPATAAASAGRRGGRARPRAAGRRPGRHMGWAARGAGGVATAGPGPAGERWPRAARCSLHLAARDAECGGDSRPDAGEQRRAFATRRCAGPGGGHDRARRSFIARPSHATAPRPGRAAAATRNASRRPWRLAVHRAYHACGARAGGDRATDDRGRARFGLRYACQRTAGGVALRRSGHLGDRPRGHDARARAFGRTGAQAGAMAPGARRHSGEDARESEPRGVPWDAGTAGATPGGRAFRRGRRACAAGRDGRCPARPRASERRKLLRGPGHGGGRRIPRRVLRCSAGRRFGGVAARGRRRVRRSPHRAGASPTAPARRLHARVHAVVAVAVARHRQPRRRPRARPWAAGEGPARGST